MKQCTTFFSTNRFLPVSEDAGRRNVGARGIEDTRETWPTESNKKHSKEAEEKNRPCMGQS